MPMPLLLRLLPLLLLATPLAAAPRQAQPAPYALWTHETLQTIEERYRLPASGLYAARPGEEQPDFAWGAGVQLSALAGASRVDERWRPALREMIAAIEAHWRPNVEGLFAYDASAGGGTDRYYDDNAWIALALVEAFEVTGDRALLERARETLDFILTGHDDTLGGGIWWHETERRSKNACSVAPTIVALLRLDEHVNDPSLRPAALRLRAWIHSTLLDERDGLISDNIRVGGRVDPTKWSYNTGLMIRANALLAQSAADAPEAEAFMAAAIGLARAAEGRWVDEETGAIRDGGRFAHLLAEAFIELSEATGDAHWRDVAERAANWMRHNTRRADGLYGERWHRPASDDAPAELIAQASAARLFARLSWPTAEE